MSTSLPIRRLQDFVFGRPQTTLALYLAIFVGLSGYSFLELRGYGRELLEKVGLFYALALMAVGVGLLLVHLFITQLRELAVASERLATDSQRLAQALQAKNDELSVAKTEAETANAAKVQFLANMSHELRTPLNAVLGFSEVIMKSARDSSADTERFHHYASDIHASGQHLLSIISDVLEASRLEAGKLTLEEAPIDIAEVVASARRLVQIDADASQIRLDTQVADLPPLLGDERAIRQILVNLLTNGVKFSEQGDHVSLVAQRESNGDLLLVVTDIGIGIEESELPKLFEPFTQVSGGLGRMFGGSGLGLSIAKGLAEAHGGSIVIKSKLGAGTSVQVRLPAFRFKALREDEDFTIVETVEPDSATPNFENGIELCYRGRTVRLFEGSGVCLLGRNRDKPNEVRCDIVVDDPRVSRPHAQIVFRNGGFHLTDQSRRGTYVVFADETRAFCDQDADLALDRDGRISLGVAPEDNADNLIAFRLVSGAAESQESADGAWAATG